MLRIAIAQINPIVGDFFGNTKKIISYIEEAKKKGADLVLFPELAICGYPPDDFLLLPDFLKAVEKSLDQIVEATQGIIAVVGLPRPTKAEKYVYNSAAIIEDGKILGYQDKALLPTYDVFDERRYFEPSLETKIWHLKGHRVAITICEDIWQHGAFVKETSYSFDPVKDLKELKPDLLLNLSASPYNPFKMGNRLGVCAAVAKTLQCPIYYANQVGGMDNIIFDGRSLVLDAKGECIGMAKAFEEELYFTGKSEPMDPSEELFKALCLGVRDYFHKQGFTKACIGLSGGIDSAVVACIAVAALGKENVLGLAMPSRYSSKDSVTDAQALAKNLGIQLQELSIEGPFQAYLDLLQPHFNKLPVDATEENLQARVRAMILMAFSNKFGYILLSTGNKSELAMGYSTLYGDLSGGLAVISDVTKKQIYEMANWINRTKEVIPKNTITKPPSAELRPNQKDTDSLPEYEIIDRVLRLYVEEHRSLERIVEETGFDEKLVRDLIRRIHRSEYKRRQSPLGLRVSEKSFTAGRKFPIVQKWVS